MCLGEIQNTPVVCSELCSLPAVANIQKVLSLLVNLASKCLFMDAAICFVFFLTITGGAGTETLAFTFVKGKLKKNDRLCFCFFSFPHDAYLRSHWCYCSESGCRDECKIVYTAGFGLCFFLFFFSIFICVHVNNVCVCVRACRCTVSLLRIFMHAHTAEMLESHGC